MHAAAVCFDLHVPESRSLKAKRSAVRPIVDGLRHRFHVSVAEVDHQDQWQRAAIAVAVVAESSRQLERVLDSVERFVANAPAVELLDHETAYLEPGDAAEAWADDREDQNGPDEPDEAEAGADARTHRNER
jgi:uncharacterized protein YlxP (DUF503 family)